MCGTKFCKKCGTEKPLDEFHNDKNRPSGKFPYCKECHYSEMRARYNARPDVRRKRAEAYERNRDDPDRKKAAKRSAEKHYQSLKGRATSLLRSAKRSPDGCTLTLDWIIAGIRRGYCAVTGVQFDLTNQHQKISGRAKNPYAPSLDRVNPKGSYSPENTRVVIWQYNMMKGELTDHEVLWICNRIVQVAA